MGGPFCRNQEAAFWLLAALVEDILQPNTYNTNLVGCQVGQQYFMSRFCVSSTSSLVSAASGEPVCLWFSRLQCGACPVTSTENIMHPVMPIPWMCHICVYTQVEMKALEEMISQKLPRLSAHLATLEADVSALALDWFLTLFCTSMPSETVNRDEGCVQDAKLKGWVTQSRSGSTGRPAC